MAALIRMPSGRRMPREHRPGMPFTRAPERWENEMGETKLGAVPFRGRKMNGNAIDRKEAPADVRWRSGHRAPPPLGRRSTKSEVFETAIKLIDVLMPLERGGKSCSTSSPASKR